MRFIHLFSPVVRQLILSMLKYQYGQLRGYPTRDGPKNRIYFSNIYDVDNEFYEKEEGAMYGPGIAD